MALVYTRLRPARIDEISPEAQVRFLGSFIHLAKQSLVDTVLRRNQVYLSMEIASIEQKSRFYVVADEAYAGYFVSQHLSHYPKTLVIQEQEDPLLGVTRDAHFKAGMMVQSLSYIFPLATFGQTPESLPLASLLGFLAKLSPEERAFYQLIVKGVSQKRYEQSIRANMKTTDAEGTEHTSELARVMQAKLSAPFLAAQVRILVASENEAGLSAKLKEMAGVFGAYTLSEGNALSFKKPGFKYTSFLESMGQRKFFGLGQQSIYNLQEAATLWHMPDNAMANVKGIDWGKTIMTEAPEHLPVAENMSDEQKREVNFFAQTEWRNHQAIFGIAKADRRKHVYIIGKTGTGKSTMLANMAINDIRNGNGVGVIDPHGDTSEMILSYIPKRRVNDVIYLDPTLLEEKSFSLNLFDAQGATHTDVVASGIISVFYKLYAHSWGPRLEYILRNAILTLLYAENATFADIITLLTNQKFRQGIVAKVKHRDPVLGAFWEDEFEKMNDKMRVESISPILNKVGQFLSSQRIRHIVGSTKSTFSLEEVMNSGKILIVNLSQGKLGEDTMALLGAMFITKMQLTAMRRVEMPEEQRPDFYLYVDEFQNFATHSFIKILSEARKYRLNLTLANQYIGQVDEEIQKAIFGNVGSLISFVVGAKDGELLAREFGGEYTPQDLVALGRYELLMKMSIDGLTSQPFMGHSLPLPAVVNDNKEKILQVVSERYYKKI